eukprot:CAMPEP_0194227832 /NCGR_PEP_ID=MMETSP0156-20130528/43061_1 /TAXON_ID=33649 /ORGANISM="Thalassionema nitzschioides, Strain L26-B" /LENGTH=181 /DNA_ID=CAMNT_0038960327 /DNA_START=424 /DNA_END=969 /DNA_ORIENTATION=-
MSMVTATGDVLSRADELGITVQQGCVLVTTSTSIIPKSVQSLSMSTSMESPVLGVPNLRNWAVVGDVLNEQKPAFRVCQRLEEYGRTVYRVSPYNTRKKKETNIIVYPSLEEIPDDITIDAVNLIISPRIGTTVLESMAKKNIQYAFIQPGADGGGVLSRADELGITVQQGCVLVTPLPEL